MNSIGRIPGINSELEARLMAEYGAIFVTTAVPPPKIIFADEAEVISFQCSLDKLSGVVGAYQIQLQTKAMNALQSAVAQAAEAGVSISARSADSGGRSYEDTLALWRRNVSSGLEHWVRQGGLSDELAEEIRNLPVIRQVETVLQLEDLRGTFFSTCFDKSILQSVAAPGASQHLSLLAFDLSEFSDGSA